MPVLISFKYNGCDETKKRDGYGVGLEAVFSTPKKNVYRKSRVVRMYFFRLKKVY